jgi:hypothetical protein
MKFFDCNCGFGLPSKPTASPANCPTLDDLEAQLARAGIDQALVWHLSQHDVSPQCGNELLAAATAGKTNLVGCWTVLPEVTGEMPVKKLLAAMKAHNVLALRAFPAAHRYLLNRETMGPLLDAMTERRIPLLYSLWRQPPNSPWNNLFELMADFPNLTLVITDHGTWGSDRLFRPLLEKYQRVHIDTARFFLDGGLEDVARGYGADRILFGSGLPDNYPGGMMLAIRHAELPEADREAIAGGNLARLLKEVNL